jgi:hypothetical protein
MSRGPKGEKRPRRRPNKRPPIEAALLPALAVSFIDGLSESHPLCGNP